MQESRIEVEDAVEFLKGFPISKNNVTQVINAYGQSTRMNVQFLIRRIVLQTGGSRWSATYKIAQAIISGALQWDGFSTTALLREV